MDQQYRMVVNELKATQKELIEAKKRYAETINQNHELTLKNCVLQDEVDTLKAQLNQC